MRDEFAALCIVAHDVPNHAATVRTTSALQNDAEKSHSLSKIICRLDSGQIATQRISSCRICPVVLSNKEPAVIESVFVLCARVSD